MKLRNGDIQSSGSSPEGGLPSPAEFANELWERNNLDKSLWRPQVQHDPMFSVPWLYPDYREWQFGKSKITVFLRDGAEIEDSSLEDPRHLEGRVKHCSYISMFDLASLEMTNEEARAIQHRAEQAAAEQSAEADSVVAMEFRLREMLGKPELKIQHIMTGVTDGYADAVFGYTLSTK